MLQKDGWRFQETLPRNAPRYSLDPWSSENVPVCQKGRRAGEYQYAIAVGQRYLYLRLDRAGERVVDGVLCVGLCREVVSGGDGHEGLRQGALAC